MVENLAVNANVEANVLPQLQPVLAMIRELMRKCAPDAKEMISYKMPVFMTNRILAYITPNKQNVTFSFVRGVEFEDKQGQLRGQIEPAH